MNRVTEPRINDVYIKMYMDMMLQRNIDEIRYMFIYMYSMNEANCFRFCLFLGISHLHTHKRTLAPIHHITSHWFYSIGKYASLRFDWNRLNVAMPINSDERKPIEMIHKWISLGLRSVRFLSILRAFTNAHKRQCHCHCRCYRNSGSNALKTLSKIATLWQIYNKQTQRAKNRGSIRTLFFKKQKMYAIYKSINSFNIDTC